MNEQPQTDDGIKLAREQLARSEAEAAQSRLVFLYQATSTLFSGPLSRATKLEQLAQLTVPHLADWCLVEVLESPGVLRRVAAHHWDPTKSEAARRLLGERALDPDSSAPVTRVLTTGVTTWLPQLDDSVVATPDPEDAVRRLRLLGARSCVVAPLSAATRTFGAVTFAFADSHRRYSGDDVRLLEDLCARAAMALESARLYEEAQRAVRAREYLLGAVSHDLRNPLSTILMAASVLQQARAPAESVELAALQGARIHRAAVQMERLIKDLLDLSAIEAGHLAVERQPHRAAVVIAEAVDLLAPLAQDKGLQLSAELKSEELMLSCDRTRVLQLFSNLVGNAIKFTPPGGRITVRGQDEGELIRITVEDTGPGIPAEQLPHIFDRFWQAHPTARKGIGLGLSIAAGIVTAHGGRIWVDSCVGQGSAFHFTLPRG